MTQLQNLNLGSPFVYEGKTYYRGFMCFPRKSQIAYFKCLQVENHILSFEEKLLPCNVYVEPYEFKKKETQKPT